MTEEQIREVQIRKEQAREEIRRRRNSLADGYRQDASEKITGHVLSSEEYKMADSVFCYVSTDDEPATYSILAETLALGKRLYVPKCLPGRRMLAVRIRSLKELVPGMYSIPEPVSADECADPGEIDLIIVPCVSMSPDRARLGHGAGYYDRFLAAGSGSHCTGSDDRSGKPLTLCLCFSALILRDIPEESCDIRMDRGVSENGFF